MRSFLQSKPNLIITFFLFTFLNFSCGKKTSELEFEKEVFYELYPSLIDSTWVLNQMANTLPNPKLDRKGKLIRYEPLNQSQLRKDYNEALAKLKNDTFKLAVVLTNRIKANKMDRNELQKHFKDAVLEKRSVSDSTDYAVDQQKISTFKDIHTKFITVSQTATSVENNQLQWDIHGIVSFSRIQFDKDKQYGFLTSSIICGGLCGNSYTIFIKKVQGKWFIDKIEHTWIS